MRPERPPKEHRDDVELENSAHPLVPTVGYLYGAVTCRWCTKTWLAVSSDFEGTPSLVQVKRPIYGVVVQPDTPTLLFRRRPENAGIVAAHNIMNA